MTSETSSSSSSIAVCTATSSTTTISKPFVSIRPATGGKNVWTQNMDKLCKSKKLDIMDFLKAKYDLRRLANESLEGKTFCASATNLTPESVQKQFRYHARFPHQDLDAEAAMVVKYMQPQVSKTELRFTFAIGRSIQQCRVDLSRNNTIPFEFYSVEYEDTLPTDCKEFCQTEDKEAYLVFRHQNITRDDTRECEIYTLLSGLLGCGYELTPYGYFS
jgi:hypothetical protein